MYSTHRPVMYRTRHVESLILLASDRFFPSIWVPLQRLLTEFPQLDNDRMWTDESIRHRDRWRRRAIGGVLRRPLRHQAHDELASGSARMLQLQTIGQVPTRGCMDRATPRRPLS